MYERRDMQIAPVRNSSFFGIREFHFIWRACLDFPDAACYSVGL